VVEQAKDPDSIVRAAAIAALGSLGSAAVKPNVGLIAQALLDESDLVRDEALLALPAAGDAMRNFPYKVARRLSHGVARRAQHARQGAADCRAHSRHG
jgi:HEAT repeat protein